MSKDTRDKGRKGDNLTKQRGQRHNGVILKPQSDRNGKCREERSNHIHAVHERRKLFVFFKVILEEELGLEKSANPSSRRRTNGVPCQRIL